jgi:hypothetical protein
MPKVLLATKDNVATARHQPTGRRHKIDRRTKREPHVLHERKRFAEKITGSWDFIRNIVASNKTSTGSRRLATPKKKRSRLRNPHIELAVTRIIEEQNPFADKDGTPQKGEELQFFEWAEKNWNKHLDTLSAAEKKKHIDAAISLSEKMND